ncbi:MAG: ribose 5-phosphate isomerase B [Alphaproteobacteria bacterium]|nr:ribose 5-phosphate isomerase B [Alphaproteobacteria bacterium]
MSSSIAIASDHAGVELKSTLANYAVELGFFVTDLGTNSAQSVDYPDYADAMAAWLSKNEGALGVLICGSGVGISIAANRHRHVRAALCHNGLGARLARQHNDANVLCLGARLVGVDVAKDAMKEFLATPFEGGRHAKRVEKLG